MKDSKASIASYAVRWPRRRGMHALCPGIRQTLGSNRARLLRIGVGALLVSVFSFSPSLDALLSDERAAQGFRPRRVVLRLSGDAWFDQAAQDGLMLAVPWKELAYQFFPNQDAPVELLYDLPGPKGPTILETDARNRLYDPERGKFLLASTKFGNDARLMMICEGSSDACRIRDWLQPFFANVGLKAMFEGQFDPQIAVI